MGSPAGIDWASEKHDVLIEDPVGEELLAATFAHDEDGISALCGAFACFDVELVAIERPDGVLVDGLLEAGMRVLALHPNQVKAARDRAATTHHRHHPRPVGPPARHRRHPANGRRRCHPKGRPNGPSAQRLTASRQSLHTPTLTRDIFRRAVTAPGAIAPATLRSSEWWRAHAGPHHRRRAPVGGF
jgi:hypothetical protein